MSSATIPPFSVIFSGLGVLVGDADLSGLATAAGVPSALFLFFLSFFLLLGVSSILAPLGVNACSSLTGLAGVSTCAPFLASPLASGFFGVFFLSFFGVSSFFFLGVGVSSSSSSPSSSLSSSSSPSSSSLSSSSSKSSMSASIVSSPSSDSTSSPFFLSLDKTFFMASACLTSSVLPSASSFLAFLADCLGEGAPFCASGSLRLPLVAATSFGASSSESDSSSSSSPSSSSEPAVVSNMLLSTSPIIMLS